MGRPRNPVEVRQNQIGSSSVAFDLSTHTCRRCGSRLAKDEGCRSTRRVLQEEMGVTSQVHLRVISGAAATCGLREGADFITEPKVHATELRCCMRDPDEYLIEVGQTTMTAGSLDL